MAKSRNKNPEPRATRSPDISLPMKVLAARFDPEEEAALRKMAADRHVTVSYLLRLAGQYALEDAGFSKFRPHRGSGDRG